MMVLLMTWAQHIVTFQGDAASFITEAPTLFKLHSDVIRPSQSG